jgi:hypothetical protein
VKPCAAWFAPDQAVRVTLLEPKKVHLMAVIADLSSKEVGLLIERSVPPGAPVCETMMLAGAVQYCRPEGPGFFAGLVLEPERASDGELNTLVQAEPRLDCAG